MYTRAKISTVRVRVVNRKITSQADYGWSMEVILCECTNSQADNGTNDKTIIISNQHIEHQASVQSVRKIISPRKNTVVGKWVWPSGVRYIPEICKVVHSHAPRRIRDWITNKRVQSCSPNSAREKHNEIGMLRNANSRKIEKQFLTVSRSVEHDLCLPSG